MFQKMLFWVFLNTLTFTSKSVKFVIKYFSVHTNTSEAHGDAKANIFPERKGGAAQQALLPQVSFPWVGSVRLELLLGTLEKELVNNPVLLAVWARQIPFYPDRSFQFTSPTVSRNQQEAILFCDHQGDLQTQRSFAHEAKR